MILTLADVLARMQTCLRSGPVSPEQLTWLRGSVAELPEAEQAGPIRWLDGYDPARVRQPPALLDFYRLHGRWLTRASDLDDTPHDLVAWAQLEIAALEAACQWTVSTSIWGFDANGCDVEPRLHDWRVQQATLRAALAALGERDAL